MSRVSRPMSLREVADMMGVSDAAGRRKLRRHLLAVESRKGVQILQSTRDNRQGRYTTTLALLRKHCPEIVDDDGEIVRQQEQARDAMRAYVNSVARRMARIEETLEELGERMDVILRNLAAQPDMTTRNRGIR